MKAYKKISALLDLLMEHFKKNNDIDGMLYLSYLIDELKSFVKELKRK